MGNDPHPRSKNMCTMWQETKSYCEATAAPKWANNKGLPMV